MSRTNELRSRSIPAMHSIYNELFGAVALCITGLAMMPAILFNPSPVLRTFQFLLLWFLNWLFVKKGRLFVTIAVFLSIVIFNLLMPYGRVLFSFGIIKITEGALMTGIQRAATLEGLVMLSGLCIRVDLKLPGKFGKSLGESLKYYSMLLNNKTAITLKNIFADIDQLMLNMENSENIHQWQPGNSAAGTKPAGYVILTVIAFIMWSGMFIGNHL